MIQIHRDDLRDGNLSSILYAFYEFSKQFQDGLERELFQKISDVSYAVGNASSVQGREITADDIIELEKSISGGF